MIHVVSTSENTMKTHIAFGSLFLAAGLMPPVMAKSPCYALSTHAFFESSLASPVAARENGQVANELMSNGEALCRRLVQAAITGKRTPDQLREGAEESLKAGKADFAKDGDMDKLEFTKYLFAITKGAADIAEAPP